MNQRVTGTDVGALETALGHWRKRMLSRDLDLLEYPLILRHRSVVAAAIMGLPDLCEQFAKPPHERETR